MSKSYIKQLIESYQNSKLGQKIGTGLLAVATSATLLTACNDSTINSKYTNSDTITESAESTIFNPGTTNPPGTYNATFGKTYNNARNNWDGLIWYADEIPTDNQKGFQLKCAPFRFLQEQGVVKCDEYGYLYAVGNEDYTNNDCIQVRALVDENSKETDLYLLVQYISAPLAYKGSNGDTFVSTWMLKYTLDADCYKDLLALNGDFKANLLIQQIDEEYKPEIISHSLIKHDLIAGLEVFKNISKTETQSVIKSINGSNNYIENIDYDNMAITVNFTSKENRGKIYSYTYKVKDTNVWDDMLVGNSQMSPVSKEGRDNLSNNEIMQHINSFLGAVLSRCQVGTWVLTPSAEQKANAQVKYDFTEVRVGVSTVNKSFEAYENGMIKYEQVNPLTQNFASSDEYNK